MKSKENGTEDQTSTSEKYFLIHGEDEVGDDPYPRPPNATKYEVETYTG